MVRRFVACSGKRFEVRRLCSGTSAPITVIVLDGYRLRDEVGCIPRFLQRTSNPFGCGGTNTDSSSGIQTGRVENVIAGKRSVLGYTRRQSQQYEFASQSPATCTSLFSFPCVTKIDLQDSSSLRRDTR